MCTLFHYPPITDINYFISILDCAESVSCNNDCLTLSYRTNIINNRPFIISIKRGSSFIKKKKIRILIENIHRELVKMLVPGTEAKALWQRAEEIAREEGLHEYFMGHRQKAGFLGHGVGIEINELPVIAPRSRDIISVGNAVALEPKFVIPGAGAVGIESTYFVHSDHVENLTDAPETIIPFD